GARAHSGVTAAAAPTGAPAGIEADPGPYGFRFSAARHRPAASVCRAPFTSAARRDAGARVGPPGRGRSLLVFAGRDNGRLVVVASARVVGSPSVARCE